MKWKADTLLVEAAAAVGSDISLGIAKLNITPQQPMALSGFGHRHGDFDGILHPLQLRVWFFQQMDVSDMQRKALVVQADILAWSTERMGAIYKRLEAYYGLTASSIILNASHTHCGPRTADLLDALNPDYVDMLEERLFAGVEEAYCKLIPVTIEKGVGECRMGINRRKIVNGEMSMAPNLEGPIDPEVSVIRFCSKLTNETMGVMFHYTCHPTTTDYNFISSEFPGIAMGCVEEAIGGGAIASYLQGCCGDIRPALIQEDVFFRGDDRDVQRFGKQLSDVVLHVLKRPMEELSPSWIHASTTEVNLPFQYNPTIDQLQTGSFEQGMMGAWHRMLLENAKRNAVHIPLKMNLLTIAEGLTFLAMNGEIVVEYGLFFKKCDPSRGVLPLAYSNGMVGYVPTAKQIEEGGYESRDSIYYFGLPSPFVPEIESLIRDAGVQLLQTAPIGKKEQ
ncbi:neutral/alkaline non-lysosomal ceramidase N-terminal domain-containing protein [Paenibacillus qinlingensis]|uniref:neutral/alkaline non-lysosomal ceramidase N-terminal domain-containing protein n=1 Tax=Paenibacillus qinlingensis TaxID=1837343 RepID=UPI0015678716|nr:neutral/alkaline non-lysosomal ceramidase N-terminal domain-containing protein [Paenibacillus qinlingensis]NQX64235.1 neutral/alkaline non-lysosomal ceramidase N-terminal domain-containing protein [Paenibacillus qinlingensis]